MLGAIPFTKFSLRGAQHHILLKKHKPDTDLVVAALVCLFRVLSEARDVPTTFDIFEESQATGKNALEPPPANFEPSWPAIFDLS